MPERSSPRRSQAARRRDADRIVMLRLFRFITAEGEIEIVDEQPVRPTEDQPVNARYL